MPIYLVAESRRHLLRSDQAVVMVVPAACLEQVSQISTAHTLLLPQILFVQNRRILIIQALGGKGGAGLLLDPEVGHTVPLGFLLLQMKQAEAVVLSHFEDDVEDVLGN